MVWMDLQMRSGLGSLRRPAMPIRRVSSGRGARVSGAAGEAIGARVYYTDAAEKNGWVGLGR